MPIDFALLHLFARRLNQPEAATIPNDQHGPKLIILWRKEDSTTLNLDRNYNKYSLEEEFSTPLLFKTFYPFSA